MSSISELPLLPLRPAGPAGAVYKPTKAGAAAAQPQSVATGPVQVAQLAARTEAPEPTRSQSAEHRLRRNRLEEGPTPSGAGGPEAELSFGDFIDLINPLHHIPIVGTIYRAITGDEISGPAKILGGMLFGGPIGFIAAAFYTIVTQATGRDLGATVVAAFTDRNAVPAVQVASAPEIQNLAAQEEAPEDNPATVNGDPGPISRHKDPFDLQRETTAPIAATPGALVPIEVTSATLPPNPQFAAIPLVRPKSVAIEGIADPAPKPVQPASVRIPLGPVAPGPGTHPAAIVVKPASADAARPNPQHLNPNFTATDRGFTERMLEALDKYRAQATERLRDNSHATDRLDLNL